MNVKLSKKTVSTSLNLEKTLRDQLNEGFSLTEDNLDNALNLLVEDKSIHYSCMKLVFDLFGDINRQFNKD